MGRLEATLSDHYCPHGGRITAITTCHVAMLHSYICTAGTDGAIHVYDVFSFQHIFGLRDHLVMDISHPDGVLVPDTYLPLEPTLTTACAAAFSATNTTEGPETLDSSWPPPLHPHSPPHSSSQPPSPQSQSQYHTHTHTGSSAQTSAPIPTPTAPAASINPVPTPELQHGCIYGLAVVPGELPAKRTTVRPAKPGRPSLLLAACRDSIVRVFDLTTGTLLHRLFGHDRGSQVFCVAGIALRTPGGVSGGEDGSVRLWDVLHGVQLACFRDPLLYHCDHVRCVAVSLSPRVVVASGGYDSRTILFDLTTATFGTAGGENQPYEKQPNPNPNPNPNRWENPSAKQPTSPARRREGEGVGGAEKAEKGEGGEAGVRVRVGPGSQRHCPALARAFRCLTRRPGAAPNPSPSLPSSPSNPNHMPNPIPSPSLPVHGRHAFITTNIITASPLAAAFSTLDVASLAEHLARYRQTQSRYKDLTRAAAGVWEWEGDEGGGVGGDEDGEGEGEEGERQGAGGAWGGDPNDAFLPDSSVRSHHSNSNGSRGSGMSGRSAMSRSEVSQPSLASMASMGTDLEGRLGGELN